MEPTSPALDGRFLTTGPPGKSLALYLDILCSSFITYSQSVNLLLLEYLHYSPSYPILSMVPILSCILFNNLILFSFTIFPPYICQGHYLVTMSGSNLMLNECPMNIFD